MTPEQYKEEFIRTHLPKTIDSLYEEKFRYICKCIRTREKNNMGKRMLNWTADYSWPATGWDWVLEELKFISNDIIGGKKWKKAAGHKLAMAAKIALPMIKTEWKTKDASIKLVALKTSVIVKQAFYDQYISLKKKKESEPNPDIEPKNDRMTKRLQENMQWIILNHEFQYEVPEQSYYLLSKQINPNLQRKIPPSIRSLPNEVKSFENNLFLKELPPNEFSPPSISIYDSLEYNDDLPPIIRLNDPYSENLMPTFSLLAESMKDMDLSSLMEVPLCDYSEILNSSLNVYFKSQNAESSIAKGLKTEEQHVSNSINDIFYTAPQDKESQSMEMKALLENNEVTLFDVNEQLEHKLYKPEDEEFMEYVNYLPEGTDPLFNEISIKCYQTAGMKRKIREDIKRIEDEISKNKAIKQSNKGRFTPFEDLLLDWSVNTVGHNWNVVADILQNHPLAKGHIRNTALVKYRYELNKLKKGLRLPADVRLDPTEDDKIPILGRFKPYFLTSRILPVYPQRYVLTHDYFNEEEKIELYGKKRPYQYNSGYEQRELKYKCTYEDNPMQRFIRNNKADMVVIEKQSERNRMIINNPTGSGYGIVLR